jgi:hypothetical protein
MHNDNDRTFLHRNLAVGVRRVKYGGFGCAYVRLHLAQVQVHKLVPMHVRIKRQYGQEHKSNQTHVKKYNEILGFGGRSVKKVVLKYTPAGALKFLPKTEISSATLNYSLVRGLRPGCHWSCSYADTMIYYSNLIRYRHILHD